MKKKVILIIGLIVGLFITALKVYASTTVSITLSGTYNYDEANKVLTLVNAERSKVGKSNLEIDYELTKIAVTRAREASLYFSHTRPNGEDVLNSFSLHGENIAAGSTTAEGVMNQWMTSSGHKANILNSNFKSIGIASFTTEEGATFWVQVFKMTKSTNTKTITGTARVTNQVVSIKRELLQQLTIGDFMNKKKLKPGDEYEIKKLRLRNEGWQAVSTVIENKNATWTSSNTSVATIDSNGKIKAVDEGKTTITAKVSGLTVSYEIEVAGEVIDITRVSLEKTSLELIEGETGSIHATVVPENTTKDKTLKYSSSDEKIATVDNVGVVHALKEGKVIITITASNGKTGEVVIVVKTSTIFATGINLVETPGKLKVGESAYVKAVLEPSNATEEITYISSNEKVATIDKTGKIKALASGTTTITAKSKKSATSYDLTVIASENKQPEQPKEIPLEGVNLNCQEITLKVGESFHFDYTYYPSNTTDDVSVGWLGSYYKIADFDPKTQTIKALAAGETKVEVFVGTGTKTKRATCKVKVVPASEITSMAIDDAPRLTFNEGRVLTLHIFPENANTTTGIKWTSSNPEIVTVFENGVIYTYEKEGTAVITATAPNGVTATRTITVTKR